MEVIQDQEHQDILPDGTRVLLQVKAHRINVFDEETQATLIKGEVK